VNTTTRKGKRIYPQRMMRATNLRLPEDQFLALEATAKLTGRSCQQFVREAVMDYIPRVLSGEISSITEEGPGANQGPQEGSPQPVPTTIKDRHGGF
jgi:hypothetical protein